MNKTTHAVRMCASCKCRKAKNTMRRYVLNSGNRLVYDSTQKHPGRGIYVCSQACYDKIQHGLRPILLNVSKVE